MMIKLIDRCNTGGWCTDCLRRIYGTYRPGGKSRESDKKDVHGVGKNVSKLPKIYSFIKLGGKDYTVHVDPYNLENTTLTEHVSEEHYYRQGPPEPRKCTNTELKEVYKCLWCNEWRAEGGQTLDPQTRGAILTKIDEYIKYT